MKSKSDYLAEKLADIKKKHAENKKHIERFHQDCRLYNLSDARILEYVRTIGKILDHFKGKELVNLTSDDIDGFILKMRDVRRYIQYRGTKKTWVEKPYSESYVEFMKQTLKVFFKSVHQIRKKRLYPECVEHITVRNIGCSVTPDQILSVDDIRRIAEACENLRDKAWVWVLFESGCRISELYGLTKGDVFFDDFGAKIYVRTAKQRNGSSPKKRQLRLIASAPSLASWMKTIEGKPPDFSVWCGLFRKNKGRRVAINAMDFALRRAAKRAGIRKSIHAHLLRHSQATLDARKLTTPIANRKYGWSKNSSFFQYYSHIDDHAFDEAVLDANGIKVTSEKKLCSIECPRCYTKNSPSNFCARCGFSLNDQSAREAQKESRDAVKIYRAVKHLINSSPDFAEMLAASVAKEELKEA